MVLGGIRRIREKRDEIRDKRDAAAFGALSDFGHGLDDRRRAIRSAVLFGGVNAMLWIIAFLFPSTLYDYFLMIAAVSNKLTALVLGMPFGAGMFLAYSLLRLGYRRVEDQSFEGAPMASFEFNRRSAQRWTVWVLAATGGAVNATLIALAVFLLAGGI